MGLPWGLDMAEWKTEYQDLNILQMWDAQLWASHLLHFLSCGGLAVGWGIKIPKPHWDFLPVTYKESSWSSQIWLEFCLVNANPPYSCHLEVWGGLLFSIDFFGAFVQPQTLLILQRGKNREKRPCLAFWAGLRKFQWRKQILLCFWVFHHSVLRTNLSGDAFLCRKLDSAHILLSELSIWWIK